MAWRGAKNLLPSEKLSGVTLRTPMTSVRLPRTRGPVVVASRKSLRRNMHLSSVTQCQEQRSERQALGEHPAMVVGMKACHGNLHSDRRGKTKAAADAYPAKAESGREEDLFFAGLSGLKKG